MPLLCHRMGRPTIAGIRGQHCTAPCRPVAVTDCAPLVWQVMLRVGDLDKSIQYYTEALGMRVLRRKDNESQKYTLAFLGYGDDDDNVAIELTCATGSGTSSRRFVIWRWHVGLGAQRTHSSSLNCPASRAWRSRILGTRHHRPVLDA